MPETTTRYDMTRALDLPYEEAVERATAALKEQGFGVLTTIDVRKTLQEKIGADFRRYVILGSCNPHLAHRALQAELPIGLMLPCNVIVYETEPGKSTVSIVDPIQMLSVSDETALEPIATEAKEKLQAALRAL